MSSRPPRFTREVLPARNQVNTAAGAGVAQFIQSVRGFSQGVTGVLDDMIAADVRRTQGLAGQEAGLAAGTQAPELRSNMTGGGRAYNEAALLAHQSALRNDIKTRVGQLALEYKDDPDGFTKQVEGLKTGLMEEAAPQLRTFVDANIADYSGRALLSIQETVQAEAEQEMVASLMQGWNTLQDDLATAAYEGDEAFVAERSVEAVEFLARLEEVPGGLTAGEIDAQAKAMGDTITQNRLVGEFQRLLESKGAEAAVERISKFRSKDPSSEGLNPNQHNAVVERMRALLNERTALEAARTARVASEAARQQKLTMDTARDVLSMLSEGREPGQQARALVAQSADVIAQEQPVLARDIARADAFFDTVSQYRVAPPAGREQLRSALSAKLASADGTVEDQVLLDSLEKVESQIGALQRNDPFAYIKMVDAEAAVHEIDFSSGVEGLTQSLLERASMSERHGFNGGLMTKAEARQFNQVLEQLPVDGQLAALGQMASAMDTDTLWTTMGVIDDEGAPLLATMGRLVAQGQGGVAREVAFGRTVLEQPENAGLLPEKSKYSPDIYDEWGNALTMSPEVRAGYEAAAKAVYAARMFESPQDRNEYDRSVMRDAARAVMRTARHNGQYVALPAGADPAMFDNWVSRLGAEDFEGVDNMDSESALYGLRNRNALVQYPQKGPDAYVVRVFPVTPSPDTRPRFLTRNGEPLVLRFGEAASPTPDPAVQNIRTVTDSRVF